MNKYASSYSADFKQEALHRMADAKSVGGLAKELGIRPRLLYEWRDQFRKGGRAGLERRRGRPPGKPRTVSPSALGAAELRIAELERLLGRKQLEVDFLGQAFEQVRGAALKPTSDGGKVSIARWNDRSGSKEKD